jgi:UDP-glucose 4-epimerase
MEIGAERSGLMEPWKGARVLVMGGAGFIGSHLVADLAEAGADVIVADDLSRGHPEWLPPAVALEIKDVVSSDLSGLIRAHRPRVIFHLAAQTSVPASMQDPQRDIEVNVVGTRRLLEAAASAAGPRFVFVSSGGAVYGETSHSATERTAPKPTSYYGMHKLLAEHYVRNARVPWAIARPANVFGPHQQPGTDGAVVPSFIRDARAGRPLSIHGDGSQVRDFVYVTDAVRALMTVAERGIGGIWNIASGTGTAICDLADIVVQAVGSDPGRTFEPRRPGDVQRSVLSAARMSRLGWMPRVSVVEGVRRTVVEKSAEHFP